MRISELAGLTDVTVRTIRYYHQIGLLPTPVTRFGVRDYGLAHVARLVRIRWLVHAGVPLTRIADMLDTATPASASASVDAGRLAVLADLHAGIAALDEQEAHLHRQREQLNRLAEVIEQGGQLSPMPAAVARFYDDMETRATEAAVRREIRRERDFMELAYYRGEMPPEAALFYEGLTDSNRTESISLFGRIAERAGPPADAEIELIAAAAVDRITRFLGPDLGRVCRRVDLAMARRAGDLYVRLADEDQRRAARSIADAVLATIERQQAG